MSKRLAAFGSLPPPIHPLSTKRDTTTALSEWLCSAPEVVPIGPPPVPDLGWIAPRFGMGPTGHHTSGGGKPIGHAALRQGECARGHGVAAVWTAICVPLWWNSAAEWLHWGARMGAILPSIATFRPDNIVSEYSGASHHTGGALSHHSRRSPWTHRGDSAVPDSLETASQSCVARPHQCVLRVGAVQRFVDLVLAAYGAQRRLDPPAFAHVERSAGSRPAHCVG